jgi:hypothetical protein
MSKIEALPIVAGWEMWPVVSYVTHTTTWHARPVGSPQAVAHADSVPGLIAATVEWLDRPQSQIDETVADLRRKLDSTPERYEPERKHLAALIETELIALRTRSGLP